MISNVNIVLCTYRITSSDTFNGISVDKIQGIEAKKNKIDDTETTAITNFVTSDGILTVIAVTMNVTTSVVQK